MVTRVKLNVPMPVSAMIHAVTLVIYSLRRFLSIKAALINGMAITLLHIKHAFMNAINLTP